MSRAARALLPALLLLVPATGSAQPSAGRLEASVRTLAGFGTRHTLSDTLSPVRGIGAARRWLHAELEAVSAACGGCLEVRYHQRVVDSTVSSRIGAPVGVVNVLATRQAADSGAPVLVLQAHYDSRASGVMDDTADAPGANDNASGTALVLEAARLLAGGPAPRKTIVFALLAGEEQGLLGGEALVALARAEGWRVEAVLNNDVVGNTEGSGGFRDTATVRLFSAPFDPVDGAPPPGLLGMGGESDGRSRQLARYAEGVIARTVPGLAPRLVFRRDRVGRGGDHIPWSEAGIPAIRFTESREHYDRQHQDVRIEGSRAFGDLPDAMDFAYLARVTAANLAVLRALEAAPSPPEAVRLRGAVAPSTTVSWSSVAGATGYRVHWRATSEPRWTAHRVVRDTTTVVLDGILIDDHYVGVSALGPGGESLVTAGRPGR